MTDHNDREAGGDLTPPHRMDGTFAGSAAAAAKLRARAEQALCVHFTWRHARQRGQVESLIGLHERILGEMAVTGDPLDDSAEFERRLSDLKAQALVDAGIAVTDSHNPTAAPQTGARVEQLGAWADTYRARPHHGPSEAHRLVLTEHGPFQDTLAGDDRYLEAFNDLV
jgi:hypothetical protein